jgi:hypothetical protein
VQVSKDIVAAEAQLLELQEVISRNRGIDVFLEKYRCCAAKAVRKFFESCSASFSGVLSVQHAGKDWIDMCVCSSLCGDYFMTTNLLQKSDLLHLSWV